MALAVRLYRVATAFFVDHGPRDKEAAMVSFSIRFSPEDFEKLRITAERTRRKRPDVVRLALDELYARVIGSTPAEQIPQSADEARDEAD